MLVPTAIYVALMPWIGIYVASVLLIAVFMRWLGRYGWGLIAAIAVGVPVVTFLIFENGSSCLCRRGRSRNCWDSESAGPPASADRLAMGRAIHEMEEIANLFHGFAVVLQPFNLLVMLVGIMLGVIIGVLPGLGGANGVAILLPLTFSMSPTSAIIMLSCIYWGALFGGAITSVLFNIPGEPWSVATTFDGHPMAQQGRAGEALDRGLHVVLRRRAVRGDHDHAGCAAGRQVRAAVRAGGKVRRLFPRLLQLRRHEQGAAVQDRGRDDDRLCARGGRPRQRHRPAAADLRLHRTAQRLRLSHRGDRPVRHRRNPADHRGRAELQGRRGRHQSEGRVPDLGASCRATG